MVPPPSGSASEREGWKGIQLRCNRAGIVGNPTLGLNPAVADHLEILRIVLRRCIGVCLVERVRHAHAFYRLLLDAVDLFRCLDAGGFEDGRNNVDNMVELRADATDVLDVTGP